MFRVINIGGKDYKIEYTIEASLYAECTDSVISIMTGTTMANNETDAIKAFIESVSNLPQMTLTMFYAGLMEHHGECGDNTIMSKADAKKLVKQYFVENADVEDKGDWYELMNICIEQMNSDNFFRQIGLEQMIASMSEKPKRTKKATK